MAMKKGQGAGSLAIELFNNFGIAAEIDASDNIKVEDKAAEKQKSKDKLQILADTVIDHLLTNMEIKGVSVEVPTGNHIKSVSGGSGAPAVGISNVTPETHTQNNDGTGRIA